MLLTRLNEADLVVNLSKCDFIKSQVHYLGYMVGHGQVSPPTAKVNAILDFPTPQVNEMSRGTRA